MVPVQETDITMLPRATELLSELTIRGNYFEISLNIFLVSRFVAIVKHLFSESFVKIIEIVRAISGIIIRLLMGIQQIT